MTSFMRWFHKLLLRLRSPSPDAVTEWIGDTEELELIKIRISGSNIGDSVLPHHRGDMKIMKPTAGHVRVFARQIADHFRVPVGLHHDLERRKRPKRFDEAPSLRKRQRMGKGRGLRSHAEEFIDNRPSDVPRFRGQTPLAENLSHLPLPGEVFVGGVDQQVGVNNEHRQPFFPDPLRPRYSRRRSRSRMRYISSRLVMSIRGGPILKEGSRGNRLRSGCRRMPWPSNSAANSESVVPRSAACRFKSRKTGSGMISVVFIWKTIRDVRKNVNGFEFSVFSYRSSVNDDERGVRFSVWP